MYVLLSGKIKVLDKQNKQIVTLVEGSVVGEIAYMINIPRTVSVCAATSNVYAVRLKSKEISNVFKLFPAFYGMVSQQMKKRKISF